MVGSPQSANFFDAWDTTITVVPRDAANQALASEGHKPHGFQRITLARGADVDAFAPAADGAVRTIRRGVREALDPL